ncbi:MAG: Hsp20/alpha crystallin family protein [Anaerolineaceae bacterium]|jgi:HSP20 family protein|nr:MAG: Hsp20/alpha crystallin family protein [Anaerolineaceae bacterium]
MDRVQIQLYPSGSHPFDENDPINFTARITHWHLTTKPHAWRPPTDLIETEAAYIVRMEIAGMNVADFTINIASNLVTINGTRWESYPDCAFYQMEIPSGDFSSSVEIPTPIDEETIAAVYENGFLHITLPKAKIKQIKVN